ncbi:MAG: DUF2252 family protein [Microbacterium sp.]
MSASPFAFCRGTAALMAADLRRGPSSGILVASCGDAHVANFGFCASPQRTLVLDLNDFDEAAWAPWEWDLKRLFTSIVVAGWATNRDDKVVRSAAARCYEHYDAGGSLDTLDKQSRTIVQRAIKDASRRTGGRAARKLTEVGEEGRLRSIEQPPTMTRIDAELPDRVDGSLAQHLVSASADVGRGRCAA